jgi:hypothetical protein
MGGASPGTLAAAAYVLQATSGQMPPPPGEPFPPTETVSAPPPQSQELTPDEVARRDRVRASARERQRKHRALVKERKMRELGVDMGNDVVPGIEYAAVLQPPPPPPHGMPPPQNGEPPFPQNQPHGGQTFATTLLLSFSCAPLLKQHLLRTLNMTNEELASLEPVIAEAWDNWDQQVRIQRVFGLASAYLDTPRSVDCIITPNKTPMPRMASRTL